MKMMNQISSSAKERAVYCKEVSMDQDRQLMNNWTNFRRSEKPERIMFFADGKWRDYGPKLQKNLILGFTASHMALLVEMAGVVYLIDFLRMLSINLVSGAYQSIAWIDVNKKRFFPRRMVSGEIDVDALIADEDDFDLILPTHDHEKDHQAPSKEGGDHEKAPVMVIVDDSVEPTQAQDHAHDEQPKKGSFRARSSSGAGVAKADEVLTQVHVSKGCAEPLRSKNSSTNGSKNSDHQALSLLSCGQPIDQMRTPSGHLVGNSAIISRSGSSSYKPQLKTHGQRRRNINNLPPKSAVPLLVAQRNQQHCGGRLVELTQGSDEYSSVKTKVVKGLRMLERSPIVTSIKACRYERGQVIGSISKHDLFDMVQREMIQLRGSPNINMAWYAATKLMLARIVEHGFNEIDAASSAPGPNRHGNGLHLYSSEYAFLGLWRWGADVNGEFHVLLCRVILGRWEVVPSGSQRTRPSDGDYYDSGVDNIRHPICYTVWTDRINTHILPEFMISFKLPTKVTGPSPSTAVKLLPHQVPAAVPAVQQHQPLGCGKLIDLVEGSIMFDAVKAFFMEGMKMDRPCRLTVTSIKNCYDNANLGAKSIEFSMKEAEMRQLRGGESNVRIACLSAPMDVIERITEHGFTENDIASLDGDERYGKGLYLYSTDHADLSLGRSREDGYYCMLLCRVILGKMEPIRFASEQTRPTNNMYDSGIDDIEDPKRYIIWSNKMNTHVLPKYVVTFRFSSVAPEMMHHVKVEAPEASQISLVANMAGMIKQVRRGILKRPRDEHEIDETDHENAEQNYNIKW